MALEHWVWLSEVLGPGSRYSRVLLNRYENAEGVYAARASFDKELNIGSMSLRKRLVQVTLLTAAEIIKTCEKMNIRIITADNEEYPQSLKKLDDLPVVLYCRGKLFDNDKYCPVAMVGTRSATEYGKQAAFSLAYRFAKSGCTVVSGIAEGNDLAAHLGSMSAKVPTVAFLPGGHGCKYPELRERLVGKILENGGAVLSEYPPDTAVAKNAYFLRNRLIAGMAEGVVVTEAPQKSGALITAHYAADQGKPIFAVMGRAGDASFEGSYALVRDGAVPVFTAADVIRGLHGLVPCVDETVNTDKLSGLYRDAFAMFEPSEKRRKKTERGKTAENKIDAEPVIITELPDNLSEDAKTVYNAFSNREEYIDDIVKKTGLGGGRVLIAMTELEISGLVTQCSGGRYMIRS